MSKQDCETVKVESVLLKYSGFLSVPKSEQASLPPTLKADKFYIMLCHWLVHL